MTSLSADAVHELGTAMSDASELIITWADSRDLGEDRDVALGIAGQLSSGGELTRGWAATLQTDRNAPEVAGQLAAAADEVHRHTRTLELLGLAPLEALAGRAAAVGAAARS